jgi:hypothetical protein
MPFHRQPAAFNNFPSAHLLQSGGWATPYSSCPGNSCLYLHPHYGVSLWRISGQSARKDQVPHQHRNSSLLDLVDRFDGYIQEYRVQALRLHLFHNIFCARHGPRLIGDPVDVLHNQTREQTDQAVPGSSQVAQLSRVLRVQLNGKRTGRSQRGFRAGALIVYDLLYHLYSLDADLW